MATSSIEICNLALDLLGIDNITSLDEGTKQSNVCKKWYDIIRKSLLTNLNATFSIARANLVEIADYVPVFGYKKAFALPNDCLKVLSLGEPVLDEYYQIEGDKFYCQEEIGKVEIRYIADVKDVTLYDSQFCELFVLDLAVAICMPLTKDMQMKTYYEQMKSKKYIECSSKYGCDNRVVVINKPQFRNARFNAEILNSNYPML